MIESPMASVSDEIRCEISIHGVPWIKTDAVNNDIEDLVAPQLIAGPMRMMRFTLIAGGRST
jgi:hypothetical protein